MRWLYKGLLIVSLCFVTTTLAIPPKAPDAKLSREDVCFAWVIHDEARGESLKGARAVYDVVLHRMVVRNKTACEVVTEYKQFSGYKRGMKLKANSDMLQRLDEVRRMRPVVPSATYFHSKAVKPSWAAKMKRILSIGGHVFYKPRKIKEKNNEYRK